MEPYIGTKIVLAEPMDAGTFTLTVRAIPGAIMPDGTSEPGFKVIYEDGYVSWSPREAFERAYRRISDGERALME